MENRLDAPIMLLFFNRPDTLEKVFAWVRSQKPKQLFLVQDGARAHIPEDQEKVMKCRQIVEDIDWECDVHKNYAETNMGCDHREFTGISWCFEHVDRLIILEDDCVPANSFYDFCAELLEKYKEDTRIYSISGFSRVGDYAQTPYHYVFSHATAGIGWATWKRCWDHVYSIRHLECLDDEQLVRYYNTITEKGSLSRYNKLLERGKAVRETDRQTGKFSSWEYVSGLSAFLNNQLVITPRHNMVQYIGITEDATHCMSNPNLLCKKMKKMLTQPAQEIAGPLMHPPGVLRDELFEKCDYKAVKTNPLQVRLELLGLYIRYGQWKRLLQAIKKRVFK